MKGGEKLKFFENKGQKKTALRIFFLLASVVTYTLALMHLSPILNSIKNFLLLFIPFYIGFLIAYLLNPLLKFFENKVFKKMKPTRLKRVFCIIIVYIIMLAFLTAICAFVIPNLISSVINLVSNFQSYYDMFLQTIERVFNKFPVLNDLYDNYSERILDTIYNLVTKLTNYLSESIPKIVKFTEQISNTFVNILLGFIISIYVLLFKERILARTKRILAVIFKDEDSEKICKIAKVTDIKTGKFIIGRIIDSLIMTVLCFIFMSIFKFPYPLLNSVIVGVFNLVPVFGSIVSAIPTAFIVLITKPSAFIYYLIFILVIQQFDGNVLGPKIQGDQLGISALWIMFSVLLFGGLFGVVGMIIGVPVFAVIYYFVEEAIEAGLIKKGKSPKTEDYM